MITLRQAIEKVQLHLLNDVALDIGTRYTLGYVKGVGHIKIRESEVEHEQFQEPTFVVTQRFNGRHVIASGMEAMKLVGLESFDEGVERPVFGGRIKHEEGYRAMASKMLKRANPNGLSRFAARSLSRLFAKPNVVVGVPPNSTTIEVRAIEAIIDQAGGIPWPASEAVLAALGCGIDLNSDEVIILADCGGGTTDIAVIRKRKVLYHASIPFGGDDLNDAIKRYMLKVRKLRIGDATAEWIKVNLGCARPGDRDFETDIHGRHAETNHDLGVRVNSTEICECLLAPLTRLVAGLQAKLQEIQAEQVPYYLSTQGMRITGGTSRLPGFCPFLQDHIGLQFHQQEDPFRSVIKGGAWMIEHPDLLKQLDWYATLQNLSDSN
jgi:rod shape-determining protein MreB and related proteins